jgi:hypothetical protein
MKLQSWIIFWTAFLATFRIVVGDVSSADELSGGVRVSPRGERRMRSKKRPPPSDLVGDAASPNDSWPNDVGRLEKPPPSFLQLIPFRLNDGTPMLRWRPGESQSRPRESVKCSGATTFSITALSITTLSIKVLFATPRIDDTQHEWHSA